MVVASEEEEEEAATGTLDLSPAAEGAVTAVPSQGADTVGRARGRAPVTLRVAVATAVDRAPVKLGSNSAKTFASQRLDVFCREWSFLRR